MEPNYIDLLDYPDSQLDITEYHTDYSILNDRSDKSSSGVWKHFGALKHDNCVDRKHVYCIQCFLNRKIKKYQRTTSTGNLSKHLRKYHRISLNQTFRIKKESENNTIVSIQKEQSLNDIDDENLNVVCDNGDGEEFLIHDINEILIGEVAKRPLLYNSTACQREKGLKHQTRRQLWTEIYEALNELIPYARLPKIWKNIRDRYHKVRRHVENAPDNYRPRYRYYEMLRFLDDAKSGHGSPSHQGEPEGEEFENYVDAFLSGNENGKYIASETIDVPVVKVESFEPKSKKVKLSATDEIQVDVAPSPKRKTLYTLVNEIIEETPENVIEKEVHLEMNQEVNAGTHFSITGPSVVDHQQLQSQMAIETTSAEAGCGHSIAALNPSIPNEKPDEFDLFGKLMAEIMRKMSKSQSRKLQLKIMGVINEIENTP